LEHHILRRVQIRAGIIWVRALRQRHPRVEAFDGNRGELRKGRLGLGV